MKRQLKHENLDILRHKILDICSNPTDCATICKITQDTPRKIYSHLKVLVDQLNLHKIITMHNTRTRVSFVTIDLNYFRQELVKPRFIKESMEGRFIHRIEDYADKHIEASRHARKEYKSARINIGISTVYHG